MNAITNKGSVTRFIAAVACVGLAASWSPSASAADQAPDNMIVAANTKASSATKASATTAANQESDLRLALDKVNLDIDTGKYSEAQDLLNRLKAKYPGNPDVLLAEANLNQTISGSNHGGLSDMCLPNSLNPNNWDILLRDNLSKGGYACAGYNRRITNQAYEQIENLSGQVALPYPGFAINFDLENDHINTRQAFTRANGIINDFYGNRQQGTVQLVKNFTNVDVGAATVYGQGNTAGGGLQYVRKDRWGGTTVMVNYNQPTWDYVETAVEYGTKSNVMIERRQVFSPDLQATLAGGYSHYALKDLWSAADAPGWDFNLDYDHPFHFTNQPPDSKSWMNDEVTLGAHYGVEAQYFTFVGRRTDSAGNPFNPLPTTSYEVHSFTLSAAKALLPNVNAQADGGYAVNRIAGNSGPIYGGSLTYTPLQHLGIDIHASRDLLGGQNLGEKQDIVGASLKWSW